MSDDAAGGADGAFDLGLPDENRPPIAGRFLLAGLAMLATLAALAAFAVALLVDERRASHHEALAQRLGALAAGRAEVLDTWLDGSARLGGRLTGSELVRLFVHEMALAEPGDPLAEALAEQLPYMRLVVSEFVDANRLRGAALLGTDDRVLVAAGSLPDDSVRRALAARLAAEEGVPFLAAPRRDAGGLVVDLLQPISAAQDWTGVSDGAPGALLIALEAESTLTRLLAPGPLAMPGERLGLVVAGEDGAWLLRSDRERLAVVHRDAQPTPGATRDYAPATADDGRPVHALGVPLASAAWTVIQEIDATEAEAPVAAFRQVAVAIALLIGLALALVFAGLWWRQRGVHHEELMLQYRALAERIQRHRRLLTSVTDTVPELIGLKDLDGRYRWVNAAFAHALGRIAADIEGRGDLDLFAGEDALRMRESDERARRKGRVVTVEDTVLLGDAPRHLQSSKVPLRDGEGRIVGLVSVARDVTELVEERRRHEGARRRAVDALVRTVELADPYLLGHSRRLAELACAIGRRFGLGRDEIATLELAASLSQLGKTFLPAELVRKPERHTPEEQALMQTHVGHTLAVLEGLDFGLPVAATIAQMHERLDGSGYPRGLAGAEIGTLARILAAVDVFCARTAPRGYRDQIGTDAALRVLADHPGRYDRNVVTALAEVVAGEDGRPAEAKDGSADDALEAAEAPHSEPHSA